MSDELQTVPATDIAAICYPNNVAPQEPRDALPAVASDAPLLEVSPATHDAVQAGAPEKYDLALEGCAIDKGLMAQAEPVFRGLGLTNDQANALLPLAPKIVAQAETAFMQRLIDAGVVQRKAWGDAFNADKQIGGAQRAESVRLADKGLNALGFAKDSSFRKTLDETGLGNHPDMIRAFRRIGELVGADGRLPRGPIGVRQDVPLWKRMYPND